jgi:hypothetical protein
MAKKVVASLKKNEGRVYARCIKMIKSPKTGSYSFTEEIVHVEDEKEFFGN